MDPSLNEGIARGKDPSEYRGGYPSPHMAPQDSPTLLGLGKRVFAPWDVDFEHENREPDKS